MKTGLIISLILFVNIGVMAQTDPPILYKSDSSSAMTNTAIEDIVYPGGIWKPGPKQYGFEIEENIQVKMDDGVALAAFVAYPTDLKTGKRAEGKFPVIVEHMPYEQFASKIGPNTFYTEYGYIVALVRARGTGKSKGEIQFLSNREGLDGKNIVEWAANLKGAQQSVIFVGCSWPGAIAINDAAHVGKNSALKAVVASCSGLGNMHTQSWIIGGLPTMSFRLFEQMGYNVTGRSEAGKRYFEYMSKSLKDDGFVAYEGGYWKNREDLALAKQIVENDVPVLLWAGWKDVVESGTVKAYTALQNAYAGKSVYAPMEKNQKTTPKYQMIMGQWEHGQGLDVGVMLQWMETWVKGVNTGIQNTKTPMHVYEMGTNRWLNLEGFNLVEKSSQWRLGKNGALGKTINTSGSDLLDYVQPNATNGKLSYLSEPIKEGTTLSGAMSSTIYAKSSNTNMVLIAHLYDVAPDGSEQLISRGAIAGSLRELNEEKTWRDKNGVPVWPWLKSDKDSYLEPEKVYRFDIALSPRQWGVLPGHRLRFEITSQTPEALCPKDGSAPPINDCEPCGLTGPQEKTVPGGKYTILYGTDTPTAINLMELPFKSLPDVPAKKFAYPWNEGMRSVNTDIERGFELPLTW